MERVFQTVHCHENTVYIWVVKISFQFKVCGKVYFLNFEIFLLVVVTNSFPEVAVIVVLSLDCIS